MKRFAITGVAGYIAPRHLKAIKETGNTLVAAVDRHDSVGIIDNFFPEAAFFTEIERFDRHLEKMKRINHGHAIDYVSICSPNHLHDAHIRLALRIDADAICEKPLVLNPWNLDLLEKIEEETGRRVYTVLQLRVHPSLIALKKKIDADTSGKRYDVKLSYITARGTWYKYSWKCDTEKSGGLASNIGIHFFDLMIWLFGSVSRSEVYLSETDRMSGALELQNADVSWFLSIDKDDLPPEALAYESRTFRSVTVDTEEIEFTNGFTDLHTAVYERTIAGNGFGIQDARPSVELVSRIRQAPVTMKVNNPHPFLLAAPSPLWLKDRDAELNEHSVLLGRPAESR